LSAVLTRARKPARQLTCRWPAPRPHQRVPPHPLLLVSPRPPGHSVAVVPGMRPRLPHQTAATTRRPPRHLVGAVPAAAVADQQQLPPIHRRGGVACPDHPRRPDHLLPTVPTRLL